MAKELSERTEAGGGAAPAAPPNATIDPLVRAALAEDVGPGDATTDVLVGDVRARGRLVAKAPGVAAGTGVFARVFELLEPAVLVRPRVHDGGAFGRGELLCEVEGPARALLTGERTALNFVQRLCGIATLTRRFVDAAGGRARVLDTRKTTPGLRALERHAVRCGGGESHRQGLWDEAMIKNNHVDVTGRDLTRLVRELRAAHGPGMVIHAEARDEAEALAGLAGGADVILLDNMPAERLAALCPGLRARARELGARVELEASGGVDLESVAAIAASGVDRVSVGALTHSAPALDLSFAIEVLG